MHLALDLKLDAALQKKGLFPHAMKPISPSDHGCFHIQECLIPMEIIPNMQAGLEDYANLLQAPAPKEVFLYMVLMSVLNDPPVQECSALICK